MSNNSATVRDTVDLFELLSFAEQQKAKKPTVAEQLEEKVSEKQELGDFWRMPKFPAPKAMNQLELQAMWISAPRPPGKPPLSLVTMEDPLKFSGVKGSTQNVSISVVYSLTAQVHRGVLALIHDEWPEVKERLAQWMRTNNTVNALSAYFLSDMYRLAVASNDYPIVSQVSAAMIMKKYPLKTLEELEAFPLTEEVDMAKFCKGMQVNPEADSGVYYRDPYNQSAPVRRVDSVQAAMAQLENLLRVAASVESFKQWLGTNDARLTSVAMLKPKYEMGKIEKWDKRWRPILVFAAHFQMACQGILNVSWKRVKNFLEDPKSCTLYNVGWNNGNATRLYQALASLPLGAKDLNAGDDMGFFVKVPCCKMMTDGATAVPVFLAEDGSHWLISPAHLKAFVRGVPAGDSEELTAQRLAGLKFEEKPVQVMTRATKWSSFKAVTYVCTPDVRHNDGSQQPALSRFVADIWQSMITQHSGGARNVLTLRWKILVSYLVTQWFEAPILVRQSMVVKTPYHTRTGHGGTTFFNNVINARHGEVVVATLTDELDLKRYRSELFELVEGTNEFYHVPRKPVTVADVQEAFLKAQNKLAKIGVEFKPEGTTWSEWEDGTPLLNEFLGFSLHPKMLEVKMADKVHQARIVFPRYRAYDRLIAGLLWKPHFDRRATPKFMHGVMVAQALAVASLCPDHSDPEQAACFRIAEKFYNHLRLADPSVYPSLFVNPEEDGYGDSPVNAYLRELSRQGKACEKKNVKFTLPEFPGLEWVQSLYLPPGMEVVGSQRPKTPQTPKPATSSTPLPTPPPRPVSTNMFDLLESLEEIPLESVVEPSGALPSAGVIDYAERKITAFTPVLKPSPVYAGGSSIERQLVPLKDMVVRPRPSAVGPDKSHPGKATGKVAEYEERMAELKLKKQRLYAQRDEAAKRRRVTSSDKGHDMDAEDDEEEEDEKARDFDDQIEAVEREQAELEQEMEKQFNKTQALERQSRGEDHPMEVDDAPRKGKRSRSYLQALSFSNSIVMITFCVITFCTVSAESAAFKYTLCRTQQASGVWARAATRLFNPLPSILLNQLELFPTPVLAMTLLYMARQAGILARRTILMTRGGTHHHVLLRRLRALAFLLLIQHLPVIRAQSTLQSPVMPAIFNPMSQALADFLMRTISIILFVLCLVILGSRTVAPTSDLSASNGTIGRSVGACVRLRILLTSCMMRMRCLVATIWPPRRRRPSWFPASTTTVGCDNLKCLLSKFSLELGTLRLQADDVVVVIRDQPLCAGSAQHAGTTTTMPHNKKKNKSRKQTPKVEVVVQTTPHQKRNSRRMNQARRSKQGDMYDAYAFAILFPEASPPVAIPDVDSTQSFPIVVTEDVGLTAVADSGITTDAYAGLVVYTANGGWTPTSAYKAMTAAASSGAFTWPAASNLSFQSTLTTNVNATRLVGCSVKVDNMATLGNLNGEWAVAQYTGEVTSSGTTVIDPASYTEMIRTGAKTVSASDIDNAGVRRAAVPYVPGGVMSFTTATNNCNTYSGLVFVWKGSAASGSATLPALKAKITYIIECVPYRGSSYLYPVCATVGDNAKFDAAIRSATQWMVLCGSSVAAAAKVLMKMGGPRHVRGSQAVITVGAAATDGEKLAKCFVKRMREICGDAAVDAVLSAEFSDVVSCMAVDEFKGEVVLSRASNASGLSTPSSVVVKRSQK